MYLLRVYIVLCSLELGIHIIHVFLDVSNIVQKQIFLSKNSNIWFEFSRLKSKLHIFFRHFEVPKTEKIPKGFFGQKSIFRSVRVGNVRGRIRVSK